MAATETAGGVLLLALVVYLLWSPAVTLELLGGDAFPLIEAGRLDSAGRLMRLFGAELMNGVFPAGHFFRPVTTLSIGLDHSWWGLLPAGYHLTDLAVLWSCAAAMFFLARRIMGPDSWPAALLVGLIYATHPVHFEILPFPARRAESLAVLFTLAALISYRRVSGRTRQQVLPALFCALAVGAKETGVVAAAALVLLAAAESQERQLTARLRDAVSSTWLALVGLAALVISRWLVLGGLGGYRGSSSLWHLTQAPSIALHYLGSLMLPEVGPDLVRSLGVVAIAAAFSMVVLAGPQQGGAPRRKVPLGAFPRPSHEFLFGWLLVVAAATSVSGMRMSWYGLPFLPAMALGVGYLSMRAVSFARAGSPVRSAVALLVAVAVSHPLCLPREPSWKNLEAASRKQRQFLSNLETMILVGNVKEIAVLEALPSQQRVAPGDERGGELFILSPHSLGPWARLRFPDRAVRFCDRGEKNCGSNAPQG